MLPPTPGPPVEGLRGPFSPRAWPRSTTRPQPRLASAASWTAHLAQGEAHTTPLSPRAHRGSSASGSPGTQRQAPTSRPPASSPPASRPPGPWSLVLRPLAPLASSPLASRPPWPPVPLASSLLASRPLGPWSLVLWPPAPLASGPPASEPPAYCPQHLQNSPKPARCSMPMASPQWLRALPYLHRPACSCGPPSERMGPGPCLSSSVPALGTSVCIPSAS